MALASFDSEQRKLCQSLTPPASQPDTVSLQKKALSALGKSGDTAICIPSDVESDTEDENDGSRELNSLQSYATRASTPDYLDLTGTEHGATESEAAICVVTAPTASSAQAEAAPAWPRETQVSHLADAEPSQNSSYKASHILTGDASASQDINFATPPTSPKSQPYLVAADGQELRPIPVSEQSKMMVDAVSEHGTCHDAQSHPDSPSTCTHSPRTTSPVEVTQASLEASEAPAGSSHDDAISEAHTPSPARSSAEPHQAQGLGDASCTPSDAASEFAEAGFESPSEAQVPSPSPSPRRSRRISMQIHKTMQSKDGDADSEGLESEDGLNGLESHYRDENSPSLADSEDSGSEDNDADGSHQGRKRRKVSKSSSGSVRSTAGSSQGSRYSRQRRSTTHATQLPSAIRTSGRDIDSPTPSQVTPVPSGASMFLARFEEWPLGDVLLKRITEGDKTTFQLQFEWPLCTNHPQATSVIPDSIRSVTTKKQTKRAAARRAKYTCDEDNFLIKLKEEEQLGWAEIRQRFAQRFSERGVSGLQVHYCTKLKDRGGS